MAKIGHRRNVWLNNDGLQVGFGTNENAQEGATDKYSQGTGKPKSASVTIDYVDMNQGTTAGVVKIAVPAGAKVIDVRFACEETWESSGASTFTVGVAATPSGFITATLGAKANMIAGAVLVGDGALMFGGTDTSASRMYTFAAAGSVDLKNATANWTKGKGTLSVTYV